MKNTTVQLGEIVVSNQGRDKGTYYIIIALLTDNYCILVNGDNKRFANPKRKIKKHLDKTGKIVHNIKAKLENNTKVFDSEIYSAIKKYKDELHL
jgi:ribosomal protein L14E/L6E/L27E